jgi:hypothetical protein
MRRKLALTGTLWMLCGALGCGPAAVTEPTLPHHESPLQMATRPPAADDAQVDEALGSFEAFGYSGDSGRVGARILMATGKGQAWDSGFLLKDGRAFFHAHWVGCIPAPSACSMTGALELSVDQMERLLPVMQTRAAVLGWDMAAEFVGVLQRSIATWNGEPLPEEVRYTAAEAIPDFIAWSYAYSVDAQGGPVMMVAGNPYDLGFLMKERRVFFHDRWEGCVPNPTDCTMEGAAELSLGEMQQLLPILEARATALGEPWVLSGEAVALLKAAIAARQP